MSTGTTKKTTRKTQPKASTPNEYAERKTEKKRPVPESAIINVKSNTFGKLIFDSKRNGERYVWGEAGESHLLPCDRLRQNAHSSSASNGLFQLALQTKTEILIRQKTYVVLSS